MKNSQKFLLLIAVTMLMSCGQDKNNANPALPDEVNTAPRSTTGTYDNDRMEDATSTNAQMENGQGITESDAQRNKQLYTQLDMSQDQINSYEKKSSSSMKTWKNDNSQRDMNMQERIQQEDKDLKSVLDESQYKKYQEWARTNPYK